MNRARKHNLYSVSEARSPSGLCEGSLCKFVWPGSLGKFLLSSLNKFCARASLRKFSAQISLRSNFSAPSALHNFSVQDSRRTLSAQFLFQRLSGPAYLFYSRVSLRKFSMQVLWGELFCASFSAKAQVALWGILNAKGCAPRKCLQDFRNALVFEHRPSRKRPQLWTPTTPIHAKGRGRMVKTHRPHQSPQRVAKVETALSFFDIDHADPRRICHFAGWVRSHRAALNQVFNVSCKLCRASVLVRVCSCNFARASVLIPVCSCECVHASLLVQVRSCECAHSSWQAIFPGEPFAMLSRKT